MRAECWPIYIQILDLKPEERRKYSNIILPSIYIGSNFPKSEFTMNAWIENMRKELLELENEGVDFIDGDGHKWKIFLCIVAISMDLDVRSLIVSIKFF